MLGILNREGIYLWYYSDILFRQIFPYWIFGILVGSIISVFGKAKIHSLLEIINKKKIGFLGFIIASLIGIISPLCMYGTIPIAASFAGKGLRQDWLAAFMMSSMLLNPQLMIYSAALGPTILIIRIIASIVCGLSAGLLVQYFFREKSFFSFEKFCEPANRDVSQNPIIRLIKNLWRNIKATGLYFIIGILLSALFERYVPNEWFISLFGSGNRGFGVLLAATIGIPLYMCGGGTIPLLMSWLDSGMSIGSATAFMITGPATKISNLSAMKIVLGAKHFGYYLLFVIIFAVLSGIICEIIK